MEMQRRNCPIWVNLSPKSCFVLLGNQALSLHPDRLLRHSRPQAHPQCSTCMFSTLMVDRCILPFLILSYPSSPDRCRLGSTKPCSDLPTTGTLVQAASSDILTRRFVKRRSKAALVACVSRAHVICVVSLWAQRGVHAIAICLFAPSVWFRCAIG